ncbi:hypothetical protein [Lacisediminihabitans sp.]|uniref:hypothetical protein n=1 Tax=Lacisediminihabitans sp. TaxID=2787631 RepID=UPI00374DA0D6
MDRRVLTRWLVVFSLLVAAFVGTVVTLNLTVYSASGFVNSYLHSLARKDADAALATPGVARSTAISTALLTPDALGDLADIRLVSDADDGDGRHTVAYRYSFDGGSAKTSFVVEHVGARLGLFSAWRFAESPLSVLAVTPLHDDSFSANGVNLVAPGGANKPSDYLVLTPASIALDHRSTFLAAPTTRVLVSAPASTVAATVDIQANRAFVAQVQKELDASLASCVTQRVLLPTGCPMGKQIDDRIQDAPRWSMVKSPRVTIVPGTAPDTWRVPPTTGTAHLTVAVRSIFDGRLSTFDEDVQFTVGYLVTLQPGGGLLITAEY